MKKLCLTLLLLAMLALPVYANGGPDNFFNTFVGGSIVFEHTPDITVLTEDLHINLSLYDAVVNVTYTLKNSGPAVDLGYTFPVSKYVKWTDYEEGEIDWIAFYDGDRRLPYAMRAGEKPAYDGDSGDYYIDKEASLGTASLYYEYIQNIYFNVDLSFAAGETKTLTVTYKATNSYSSGGSTESGPGWSDVKFLYDLTPASAWGNGKAGQFNLTLDYTALHEANDIRCNLPGFAKDPSGIYTYSAKDLDFAQMGIISAAIDYPFEQDYIAANARDSRYIRSLYASSTLPHSEGRYRAENLFDGDIYSVHSTDGSGIGESIEFVIAPGVDVYLLNGFIETQALYYNNARIKRIKLEVWEITDSGLKSFTPWYASLYDPEPAASWHVDLEDIPYVEIDHLNPVKNAQKILWAYYTDCLVRLTIEEVYPGDKYTDTCISEVLLYSDYHYGGTDYYYYHDYHGYVDIPEWWYTTDFTIEHQSMADNFSDYMAMHSPVEEPPATQPPAATTAPPTTKTTPADTAPAATIPHTNPPEDENPEPQASGGLWLAALTAVPAAGGGFLLGRKGKKTIV